VMAERKGKCAARKLPRSLLGENHSIPSIEATHARRISTKARDDAFKGQSRPALLEVVDSTPAHPRPRRASKRSPLHIHVAGRSTPGNAGSLPTWWPNRARYTSPPRPSSAGRSARCPKLDLRGTLNSYSVPTTALTEQAEPTASALRTAQGPIRGVFYAKGEKPWRSSSSL
jgi:hypothetical protein